MTTMNNGGPAFPGKTREELTRDRWDWTWQDGMSLRDYFAGNAMLGMCTGAPAPQKNELDYIADRSYEMADAMLIAREKGTAS